MKKFYDIRHVGHNFDVQNKLYVFICRTDSLKIRSTMYLHENGRDIVIAPEYDPNIKNDYI